MKNLNLEFTEEYEKINNALTEKFSCEKGISAYTAEMEKADEKEVRKLSCWYEDLKAVKHLDEVYHNIEKNPEYEVISYDMALILRFRSKIYSGDDPLSMLYKIRNGEYKRVDISKLNIGLSDIGDLGKDSRSFWDIKIIAAVLITAIVILGGLSAGYFIIN